MRAVLECALFDLYKWYGEKRYIKELNKRIRETEEWFSSKEYIWFYSFENICAVFDLDPDYIRMGIRRLKNGLVADRISLHKFFRSRTTVEPRRKQISATTSAR